VPCPVNVNGAAAVVVLVVVLTTGHACATCVGQAENVEWQQLSCSAKLCEPTQFKPGKEELAEEPHVVQQRNESKLDSQLFIRHDDNGKADETPLVKIRIISGK